MEQTYAVIDFYTYPGPTSSSGQKLTLEVKKGSCSLSVFKLINRREGSA